MIASTLISHHTDTDVLDTDMESLEMLPGQMYDCIPIDNETTSTPADTNKVSR